jgi:hypothetical protein
MRGAASSLSMDASVPLSRVPTSDGRSAGCPCPDEWRGDQQDRTDDEAHEGGAAMNAKSRSMDAGEGDHEPPHIVTTVNTSQLARP